MVRHSTAADNLEGNDELLRMFAATYYHSLGLCKKFGFKGLYIGNLIKMSEKINI